LSSAEDLESLDGDNCGVQTMAETMPKKGSRIPERLNEILVNYTIAFDDSIGYGDNIFGERPTKCHEIDRIFTQD
jgi:hypothetical protein